MTWRPIPGVPVSLGSAPAPCDPDKEKLDGWKSLKCVQHLVLFLFRTTPPTSPEQRERHVIKHVTSDKACLEAASMIGLCNVLVSGLHH